jgi:UDP-glucose 4-epimerase
MVVPSFVKQALAGTDITVYGDGTQSRCFGYVADVVDALIRLMNHRGSIGDVFNIGSTEEISILDLARRVKTLVGSPSAIVHVPYDEAYEAGFEDMPRRVPDVSKIDQLIGFRATTTLDDILHSVIDFHAASADSQSLLVESGAY